jgi:hypothetical protein
MQKPELLINSGTINKPLSKFQRLAFLENISKIERCKARSWLTRRGKNEYVDFSNKDRRDFMKLFNELDTDSSGMLSIEEVYHPLRSLGLVQTRVEIREILKKIDPDQSELINFEEFLYIMKVFNSRGHNIIQYYKSSESHDSLQVPEMPFNLILCNRRRSIMMQAYIGETHDKREYGQKMIESISHEQAYAQPLVNKPSLLKKKREKSWDRYYERIKSSRGSAASSPSNKLFLTSLKLAPIEEQLNLKVKDSRSLMRSTLC